MTILQRNITLLTKTQPQLAAILTKIQPTQVQLSNQRFTDLIVNKEPFYQMDARQACHLQVDAFFKHPTHHSVKIKSLPKKQFRHQVAVNNLNQHAVELGYKQDGKPVKSNLLALGAGLGFYLSELMQHMTFRNIILVEPNNDMLYYFLQHIDIDELSSMCSKNGGIFTIVQPKNYAHYEQLCFGLYKHIGFDVLSEMTVFRHYETELFNNIYTHFKELRNRLMSAWGYFEDEMQGLRHTLKNVSHCNLYNSKKQTPLLNTQQEAQVFIVGNGPSLDNCIKTLKENQHQIVVVSCGSALGSLLRSGIIPDIHVEMERSLFTASVQKKWFTPELTQRMWLLALNTVAPETIEQFKQVLLFPKAKDLGGHILKKASNSNITDLYYCNPTVTNFALSAMITLGFKKINLLGCDYGYRNKSVHHSGQSDYYDGTSRLAAATFQNEVVTIDNLGKPINSSRIFNLARKNIEALLVKHKNVKVNNCSDGAKIQLTSYVPIQDLIFSAFDKTKFIQNLVKSIVDNHASLDKQKLIGQLNQFQLRVSRIQTIIADTHDAESGLRKLKIVTQEMEKSLNQDFSHVLFLGDFRYISIVIYGHLNRTPDKLTTQYWMFARKQIVEMCEQYENMLSDFLKDI